MSDLEETHQKYVPLTSAPWESKIQYDTFSDSDGEIGDDKAVTVEESSQTKNKDVELTTKFQEETKDKGLVVTPGDYADLDIDVGDQNDESREWWDLQSSVEEKIMEMTHEKALAFLVKRKDGLYRAMQMNINPSILEKLAFKSKRHSLAYADKTTTREGENVLHAAVLSNDNKKISTICDVLSQKENEDICRYLLDSPAHSRDRKGTVMEGEYVLSVAALKLNKETVNYLLKLGADVKLKNSRGDNVIHSLIRYAARMPDKMVEIRDMIKFIYRFSVDSKEIDVKRLFTMVNNNHLTPLKLAVVMNVSEVCADLLSLKNVYLSGGREGIYERKIYDITYLDSLTNRAAHREKEGGDYSVPKCDSVIEMIFANNTHNDTALAVVNHEIIAYIIKLKWRSYFSLFLTWVLFHYAAMIILTAYSIVRIDIFFHNNSRNVPVEMNGGLENDFVVLAYWLSLIFGFVFSIPLFLFIFSRTVAKPNVFKNTLHNIDYFVMYFVFVISIFIDSIFLGGGSMNYNGEALVFSVLFGWLFSTIFLRAIPKCGQITFLVRRVIVRDILGFVLVFFILLIAFTTCLHDLLKYKIDDNGQYVLIENFRTFGRTLFTMYHAMLGLSDIDEVFDSRSYWLAISLLIVFLIITYGLLLNALIGIISSTSEEIFAHKHGYMSVHRLSVLIFMEEFFLLHLLKNSIGIKKDRNDEVIFQLEIKSESSIMTEENKVITKEKEENLKLRNVVHDALHISETVVYGYKCVDCKRREMVLAANDNAVDYKIRQTFKLDSEGKPIDIKLKNTI